MSAFRSSTITVPSAVTVSVLFRSLARRQGLGQRVSPYVPCLWSVKQSHLYLHPTIPGLNNQIGLEVGGDDPSRQPGRPVSSSVVVSVGWEVGRREREGEWVPNSGQDYNRV